MVGANEIYGSIGCLVTKDTVALVKCGKTFFSGSYEPGSCFTITMRIRHGILSFHVDGKGVNSEELEGMKFHGCYKLGVSFSQAQQEADVFFDCPVTFEDTWSAGDVRNEMLLAKKSTNFSFYSEQVLSPQGKYKIVANVWRNCSNSVAVGTVPVECQDLCRSNLVGMKAGSLGCIIKDGNIFVAISENVVFKADVNTNDPCVISMTIKDGQVSFKFDGKSVNCEELKSTRLSGNFRIGVGLSCEGQVVEMRGDGQIPKEKTAVVQRGSGGGSSDMTDLGMALAQLVDVLTDGIGSSSSSGGSSDDPRWKDNMRSVNCDATDRVAASIKKFTATTHSQCVVSASGNTTINIRILQLKAGQLMMVGVMDENTNGHANNHLGAYSMKNSLALTSRGDLVLKGETHSTGCGFGEGDLVTLSFVNGTLTIGVNGQDAVPELGNFSFKNKFRWAVSFTDVGQAVKIGEGGLTDDELAFCLGNGVQNPCLHPEPFPHTDTYLGQTSSSDGTLETGGGGGFIRTESSNVSGSSRRSHDDLITGCFIDVADLKYGGRTLGEGTFGKVYKGTWDDSDVAIKEIPWLDDDMQRREIAVGRSLTQPNIATILGWSRKDNTLLVVMPLFRKGSLADKLAKVDKNARPTPSTGGPFGFNFSFGISLGLLRAIKYMASRKPDPFIHRDIKPANVLLDDNNNPMLTDFGTARSLEKSLAATTNCGTPFYMAAEQAKGEGTSPATDVHAVALIIYEILYSPRAARQSSNQLALMMEIGNGTVPPLQDVHPRIGSILKPAFSANPTQRPTAAEMVASFEKIRLTFSTVS